MDGGKDREISDLRDYLLIFTSGLFMNTFPWQEFISVFHDICITNYEFIRHGFNLLVLILNLEYFNMQV